MKKVLLFIQQKMCLYLRRNDWVVFYLEEEHRHCRDDFCWLKLYSSEEKQKGV